MPLITSDWLPHQVREGRDAGVFPPRDEERIFGPNLPRALQSKPFPEVFGWLSPAQRKYARGLALTIWQRGAEDLDPAERRLCEGLGLLCLSTHTAVHHAMPLGKGGAQLILAPSRAHLWPFPPPSLRLQPAVLGGGLPLDELHAIDAWARRRLTPGEVGIVLSNVECWQHALEAGWEWTLILEDDAAVVPDLAGGALQLLALVPELVASATEADSEWQLLCLSPHGLEPFYELCEPEHIPSLLGARAPSWARRPKAFGDFGDFGWRRVGPTFHAFAWLYRAPLMQKLLAGWRTQSPPLNPLDVWVWEVMATNGVLDKALAPMKPLASTRDLPGGAASLRQQQGPATLRGQPLVLGS